MPAVIHPSPRTGPIERKQFVIIRQLWRQNLRHDRGLFSAGNQDGHTGRYTIKDGPITQRANDRTETDPELIFDMDGTTYIGQQAVEQE